MNVAMRVIPRLSAALIRRIRYRYGLPFIGSIVLAVATIGRFRPGNLHLDLCPDGASRNRIRVALWWMVSNSLRCDRGHTPIPCRSSMVLSNAFMDAGFPQ